MDDSLPTEISVSEVRDLTEAGEDFLLLDCRELGEYEFCRIDQAKLIPLQQIPGNIDTLEPHRQQRIVVMCHHGHRSLRAVLWLRQNGFDRSQSMAGGIDAWSTEIDSRVPRY